MRQKIVYLFGQGFPFTVQEHATNKLLYSEICYQFVQYVDDKAVITINFTPEVPDVQLVTSPELFLYNHCRYDLNSLLGQILAIQGIQIVCILKHQITFAVNLAFTRAKYLRAIKNDARTVIIRFFSGTNENIRVIKSKTVINPVAPIASDPFSYTHNEFEEDDDFRDDDTYLA